MASVSSLDQDMRNLRMGRYTPQAANQVRQWIEETLNEPLPSGDLLDALKDGVALCKLANLLLQPSHGAIKFKASPMPFIQMENISHFLKACEMPPLNMPAHDRFLTVDLYESKDPAQVLQCLVAFSRTANSVKPQVFRTTIGPKKAGGVISPSATGGAANGSMGSAWKPSTGYGRSASPTKPSAAVPGSGTRAMSPSLTGGSNGSQKTDTGPVSSWSKRSDEGNTAPAWNIHQYGYMGGASQGNQGISFGARRQITSQAPSVPSLAEKERLRKEKAAEDERTRQQAEEAEQRRRVEREAEEERAQADEERRWEEETRRVRDEERRRMEEQKRQWEEQERRWKEEEEVRRKEEADFMQQKKLPPQKPRVPSSGVLRGQTLSQYQKEQAALDSASSETPEQKRVRELEKQLEEARERERQYQAEREEKIQRGSRPSTRQTDTPSETSWVEDERETLRQEWQTNQANIATDTNIRPQSTLQSPPIPTAEPSYRPLPRPVPEDKAEAPAPLLPQRREPSDSANPFARNALSSSQTSAQQASSNAATMSSPPTNSRRPLPTPDKEYSSFSPSPQPPPATQPDRSLPATSTPPAPRISSSREAGDTSLEQQSLRDARIASQTRTIAGGKASKSLLEREMERERERQREWEANQATIKEVPRDTSQGTKPGESWDVNQYGFTGGDGMNKGSSAGSGIDFGGRRQILGPREMKR